MASSQSWRQVRNVWIGAIVVDAAMGWAYGATDDLCSGATSVAYDFLASIQAYRRCVERIEATAWVIAILVVPFFLSRYTARWLRERHLGPLPRLLHYHRRVFALWLVGYFLSLAVLKSTSRSINALPVVLALGLYGVYAASHPRLSLLDD